MEFIGHYNSPLGDITMASDGTALTGLWFDGQKYFGAGLDPENKEAVLPVFSETAEWLDIYFSGRKPGVTPQLRLKVTAFRREVLKILLTVPYGETVTYGDLAKMFSKQKGVPSMSAQAIGSAVGHNPISIIIPCHRVVGSDGSLTGYAGGLDRKLRLLALEKAACS